MKKKIILLIVLATTVLLFITCKKAITSYHQTRDVVINNIDFKTLQDGTYTGIYNEGMNSLRRNEVKVTIFKGQITNIELVSSAENRPVEFNNELYGRVMQKQSLEIDIVSGATITSKAYLKAIENALIKAQKKTNNFNTWRFEVMKVTAFIGSARKKHTYTATENLLKKLQSYGDIEYELVPLNEYNLKICKGCKLCCDKGEELCPLKDDRDILLQKIIDSDGVIFASPNYSFQVSGQMKVFLDRFGFLFHRPRYFGKTFTSIVAQGIYGGDKIVKYFNFIGKALGCKVVKGSCIKTLEPMAEKQEKKNHEIIEKQSEKFYKKLIRKEFPTPSLFDLMIFRLSRTGIKSQLDENFRDYTYYKDKDWFESDFFYPVKLNPFKKLTGRLFDAMA